MLEPGEASCLALRFDVDRILGPGETTGRLGRGENWVVGGTIGAVDVLVDAVTFVAVVSVSDWYEPGTCFRLGVRDRAVVRTWVLEVGVVAEDPETVRRLDERTRRELPPNESEGRGMSNSNWV